MVGDVTAAVDNPSELMAWATILTRPDIVAWQAHDAGHRYVEVAADHVGPPVRGRVAAVLDCGAHQQFWEALGLDGAASAGRVRLGAADLSAAWSAMPVTVDESIGDESG